MRAIEECAHGLNRVSWNSRLLVGPVVTALVMALIGVGMVRCEFSDRTNEAKRYEAWGRKVEEKIATHSPEDQEKIYRWIGARP